MSKKVVVPQWQLYIYVGAAIFSGVSMVTLLVTGGCS